MEMAKPESKKVFGINSNVYYVEPLNSYVFYGIYSKQWGKKNHMTPSEENFKISNISDIKVANNQKLTVKDARHSKLHLQDDKKKCAISVRTQRKYIISKYNCIEEMVKNRQII